MSPVPSPEKLFQERHQNKRNCIFVIQHHGQSFLQHFLHTFPRKRVDKVTSQAKVLNGHIVISLATEGKGLSISQPPLRKHCLWGQRLTSDMTIWARVGPLLSNTLHISTALKNLCKTLQQSRDTASQANGRWMWYSEQSGSTGEVMEQEQFTQSWTNAGYKADFPCLLLRTLDRKLL